MRTVGGKRGVLFFTVDALIAGVILTLTVILLLSFLLKTPYSVDAKYYIDGYSDYILNTKMNQFRGNYQFVYYDPNEPTPNIYVYEKILYMQYNGYPSATITSFIENFTSITLPEHVGVEYKLGNDVLYSRHTNRINDSDIYLSQSIFTFVADENTIYGPNVTKITIWV
ncbi:MAG: hypothetical protein ACP5N3_02605 [Candidatus Nanoarchaeia archaeon]